MKADLHYHGMIGMHEPWLSMQGYEAKNLMGLVYDAAMEKEVDVIAIISERGEDIIKGSEHDRFNYLFREAERLPKHYFRFKKLGDKDIAFIFEKDSKNRQLIVLNGQTVAVNEGGKRYDHLVIGSNQVPNGKPLLETLEYCKENRLIQILEHPFYESHFGLGERLAEEYLKYYDAVEGHNSQMTWPEWLSWVPMVGKANKGVNTRAKKFAWKHSLPWIADSDGHRIKDVGISNIEFSESRLDVSNEEKLLASLKRLIRQDNFENNPGYQTIPDWLSWTGQFIYGVAKGEKREVKRDFK